MTGVQTCALPICSELSSQNVNDIGVRRNGFDSLLGEFALVVSLTKVQAVQDSDTTSRAELLSGLNVLAYPNPAISGGELQLDISAPRAQGLRLHLLTLDGRAILTRQLQLQPGNQLKTLNLPALSAGLYVLQLESAGSHATLKLLINR